jgi:osmotically-inducible protein OsmY
LSIIFQLNKIVMSNNHRNQWRNDRSSNQEWDDNRGRQQRNWEQREDFGSQWNRDSGYSDSNSRYGREGSGNYDQDNEYGSSRYGRENSGQFGNQDRNYGYGGREYGSQYGGGIYQGNSSYYGSGQYGSGGSSYGSSRNLYDRDYEGFNRGSNRSRRSEIGGSNYGGYGDWNRGSSNEERYGRNRGYGDSDYSNYGYESNRERYGEGNPNERSWWDRTRDEVSSWFGDDDAERRRERDRRMSHRGKGPRNYKRSDERIKEDINDRLSDDPFVDASEIEVTVNAGEVTLTGTVDDRSDKRRAEDLAEAVSGVKNVENRIRVTQRSETPTSRSTVGTGSSVGTGSGYETGVTGVGSSSGTTTGSGKSSKGNLVTNN